MQDTKGFLYNWVNLLSYLAEVYRGSNTEHQLRIYHVKRLRADLPFPSLDLTVDSSSQVVYRIAARPCHQRIGEAAGSRHRGGSRRGSGLQTLRHPDAAPAPGTVALVPGHAKPTRNATEHPPRPISTSTLQILRRRALKNDDTSPWKTPLSWCCGGMLAHARPLVR